MVVQNIFTKTYAIVKRNVGEGAKKAGKECLTVNGAKVLLHAQGKDIGFDFDAAFGSNDDHASMIGKISDPALNYFVDGYNACLMFFGSGESGKTYALTGGETEAGFVKQCIDGVYKKAQELGAKKKLLITVSFIEIVENETLDLLNPHSRDMFVRNHPRFGIYVQNLSEFVVQSKEEILEFYEQGCKCRKFGTKNNETHRPASFADFVITFHQKSSDQMTVKSHLHFMDMPSISVAASMVPKTSVYNLLEVIRSLGDSSRSSAAVEASRLTRYLQDALAGNCMTSVCVCLSSSEALAADSFLVLQNAALLKNIKHKVQLAIDENDYTVRELREEISRLREKIVVRNPNKEDVLKLESMVDDLQFAKQQSWDALIRATVNFTEERKANYANKGLSQTVLGGGDTDNKTRPASSKEVNENLIGWEKEKDKLSKEYKAQRAKVDVAKEKLTKRINTYAQSLEDGKLSDAQLKEGQDSVNTLKQALRAETDRLVDIGNKLRNAKDSITREKIMSTTVGLQLLDTLTARKAGDAELKKRLQNNNKKVINDELEQMKIDVQSEKAELKARIMNRGDFSGKDDIFKFASQVSELTAEKKVVTIKIQLLEKEIALGQQLLEENYQRHLEDIEKLRSSNFQVFREYRTTFERQKAEIEANFRQLLDNSVQDAVFLSTRNNELMMENTELRKEISLLKDTIGALEGGNPNTSSNKKK